MKRAFLIALSLAVLVDFVVSANDPPQVGPNNNVVGGVLTTVPTVPPATQSELNQARIKSDLLMQRQNEPVLAASTRNPDHLLAAANDYRTVEIFDDAGIGETGNGAIARFVAKLFGRPRRRGAPKEAAAAEAWIGIYRSCDRGRTWFGSLLPGSPNDNSPASLASPLKGFNASTDAVMAPLTQGKVAVGGLAFTRGGASKIFSALYQDQNNREGGACFHFVGNSVRTIEDGASSATGAFADKPAMASDARDGKEYVYMSYTVFNGTQRDGRVRSKLKVARSWDGGLTWTTVEPKINKAYLRSQGSAIAVDPLTGHVYVVWRLFYDNVMMLVKSTDFGVTWSSPITITWTQLQAFDQGTGGAADGYAFRSNAFPTITAAVVNGSTKLFAAWQERVDTDPSSPAYGQPKAGGSPRIVLTTSTTAGAFWTARRAIDLADRTEEQPAGAADKVISQPPVPPAGGYLPGSRPAGPQVMPSLSASGGRVMLLYYEARRLPTTGEELSPGGFITGIDRQMDVRVVEIEPATGMLAAPSTQVSQYGLDPTAPLSDPKFVETAPGYSAVNRPNLPMYKGGFAPFVGDYIFLAPAKQFIVGSPWRWPTADDLPSPSFHSVFNDNRMVRYPGGIINGDWTKYKGAGDPACENPGSRNADIFHSEIGGLIAGSPQTFKQLGFADGTSTLMQRAFVAYVSNRTGAPMSVLMTVEDDGTGVDASLLQFDEDDDVNLALLPHSTVTRTVYARSANATASFRVRVEERNADGTPKAGGRLTYVVFNPDPTNPQLDSPPSVPAIGANETHTPKIAPPKIDNTHENSPYNPQIDSPQIDSPQIDSPQIDSPQIDSPQIDSTNLSSSSLDDSADGRIDVVWKVHNDGNTSSAYNSFVALPNASALIQAGWQFQLVVAVVSRTPGESGCQNAALLQTRVISNIPITSASNPQIDSPQIDSPNQSNPQIDSPQIDSPQIDSASISNASFALAPTAGIEGQNSHGEGTAEDAHGPVLPQEAIILLRGVKTVPAPALQFDPESPALLVKSQAVKVLDGVVQGTEVESDFSGPDLTITSGGPTLAAPGDPEVPQSTFVAGDEVLIGGVTVENQGDQSAAPYSTAHVLSTTTSPEDGTPLADPVGDPGNDGLAAGSSEVVAGVTFTIPSETLGIHYVVVEADSGHDVAEGDNFNNIVNTQITIAGPLTIVGSPNTTATFDQPFGPLPFPAINGVPPYTWTATGLPPGLSLSTLGPSTSTTITGTPAAVGAYIVTVQATDAAAAAQPGNVANHAASFTLTITVALTADAELAFTGQPSALVTAGKRLNAVPEVKARRSSNGKGIPGVSVSLALGTNPASATLFGTTSKTTSGAAGSEGLASFSNTWIDKTGTPTPGSAAVGTGYTLVASSTSHPVLAPVTSSAVQVVAKKILIYGPSFIDTVHPSGAPHPPTEKTLAEAAGYAVTVASATTWAALGQSDFAAYNAVVIPDPNLDNVCCDSAAEADAFLSAANNATSKTAWSNAVSTGPKIVHATDPILHLHDIFVSNDGGAGRLITNSINFAASEPDTGLFASLSFYYHTTTSDTTVSLLDQLGAFTVKGLDSDVVKIKDKTHAAMSGLTDSTDDCSAPGSCPFHLANWGQSVHSYFTARPSAWKALVVESSTITEKPYIISSK